LANGGGEIGEAAHALIIRKEMGVQIVGMKNRERADVLRKRGERKEKEREKRIYFSHLTDFGSVRSHAMESVTPEEIVAQALVWAVRSANSSVDPEAMRQEVMPLNSMQTSTRWAASVFVE